MTNLADILRRFQVHLDGNGREDIKRQRSKGCLPSTTKPAKPFQMKKMFVSEVHDFVRIIGSQPDFP